MIAYGAFISLLYGFLVAGGACMGALLLQWALPSAHIGIDSWVMALIAALAFVAGRFGRPSGTGETAMSGETATIETRISEEREKLRSMLLSSISHDLKTPIAGIIGALSVHRSMGQRLTQGKRDELIEAAIEEAQRLDSFITNILDMTRLESGNIKFKREWHDMEGVVGNIIKRLQYRLRQHELVVHPFPTSVETYMDVGMTGQVVQNLLDNACKYTELGTCIEIRCFAESKRGFVCEIRDHGKGLPPEKLDRIFNKYERLHKKDMQIAGTGLGLAISKAIIEAQGGQIKATNHPEGGAVFTFSLPEWRAVEAVEDEARARVSV